MRVQLDTDELPASWTPILDANPELADALRLLRMRWSRGHIAGLGSGWRVWEVFCDLWDLDPEHPSDADVAAFVESRVQVGVSWGSIDASLRAIRLALDGSTRLIEAGPLTIAATRHLTNRHDQGWFDPAEQAPIVSVGEVWAIADAAGSISVGDELDDLQVRARDRFMALITYAAALRPGEWERIDLEHVAVDSDGVLQLVLPATKTGDWVKTPVRGRFGIDPAEEFSQYLDVRGDAPGPLISDCRRVEPQRVSVGIVADRLTALAAFAGIPTFSSYSLRRSSAVHAHLSGVSATGIRRLLRHSENSEVFRRYVEPWFLVIDRDGATARYLNPRVATRAPLDASSVVHQRQVTAFSLSDRSPTDLLTNVDLPRLRVHPDLAEHSEGSLDTARRTFRRWSSWCIERSADPAAPSPSLVSQYLVERSASLKLSTVRSEFSSLQTGWILATGSSAMPGVAQAEALLAGMERKRGDETSKPRSRPCTDQDLSVIKAHFGSPTASAGAEEWAKTVLSNRFPAATTLEVVDVEYEQATIVVDDTTRSVVERAANTMFCPVAAADRLADVGTFEVNPDASMWSVIVRGREMTRWHWRKALLLLAATSGARPSDLARARLAGVEHLPGGLRVALRASKGNRPGKTGRAKMIWTNDTDAIAAVEEWLAWWPYVGGPLFPRLTTASTLSGELEPVTAAHISRAVNEAIREAGVADMTGYGFRYGTAQNMHDADLPDEVIAEVLGHDNLETTRGYIQRIDPFRSANTIRNELS